MSFLSLMEAKLPPGFRFHPRDEELVRDYLAKKVAGTSPNSFEYPMMIEVDLNKIEPWDLPEMACVGGKEWYFFSLRDRKYATGLRTNRATVSGYWKATGKDRPVIEVHQGTLMGMRKTLVFYQGRAPKGQKTDWVMHEFRLEGPYDSPKIPFKEDWVLCRVFHKNKGMSTKPCQENSYDDTVSSSPPPPLDSFLNFDQHHLNIDTIEQVPCFSNFSHNSINVTPQELNQTFSQLPQLETDVPTNCSLPQLEPLPDLGSFVNPFSCDKKVIKAVLDHFSNLGNNQRNMVSPNIYGEGSSSSDSCLYQMGFPNMWNNY